MRAQPHAHNTHMVWAQTTPLRRRDARFQQLALDSTIGQLVLQQFENWLETHDSEHESDHESEREAVVKQIVDSARAALFNHGVPEGFHNHCLRLLQHDAVTGSKPPLKCRICGTFIAATRDYACSIKSPCCRPCASAEQVYV